MANMSSTMGMGDPAEVDTRGTISSYGGPTGLQLRFGSMGGGIDRRRAEAEASPLRKKRSSSHRTLTLPSSRTSGYGEPGESIISVSAILTESASLSAPVGSTIIGHSLQAVSMVFKMHEIPWLVYRIPETSLNRWTNSVVKSPRVKFGDSGDICVQRKVRVGTIPQNSQMGNPVHYACHLFH